MVVVVRRGILVVDVLQRHGDLVAHLPVAHDGARAQDDPGRPIRPRGSRGMAWAAEGPSLATVEEAEGGQRLEDGCP